MLVGDKISAWQSVAVAILGPVAGYAGTLAKSWIERSNVRTRRTNLCEEAARLIKFHATLGEATMPSPRVQNAQAAIANELDRVLEQLSQSLTESPGSAGHPRSGTIITLENWLLLYRPHGFWAWVLHSLFFMMVPLWFLVLDVGFINDIKTHANPLGVSVAVLIVFSIPIVLCNYAARKLDQHSRQRSEAAQAALPKATLPASL